MGLVEEIRAAATSLAAARLGYITGTVLTIDGGG
jgi:NAD(P)-dependent dehydrogenase (short-subunit alcohol dehydrogenase family)